MSEQVIHDYVTLADAEEHPALSPLSPREREVLAMLAEGLAIKQVADQLALSVKTIETHRKAIMDKLGIHSIAELTKVAIREGLTALD